jgi:hypothetical protein
VSALQIESAPHLTQVEVKLQSALVVVLDSTTSYDLPLLRCRLHRVAAVTKRGTTDAVDSPEEWFASSSEEVVGSVALQSYNGRGNTWEPLLESTEMHMKVRCALLSAEQRPLTGLCGAADAVEPRRCG